MAKALSIQDRIAQSKRAHAVERAWQVAKAHEGSKAYVEGLHWVEPTVVEGRGITRRVDFAREFPDGVTYVMPVPLNLSVIAPAEKLVPGEDIHVLWTMPLLTRTSAYEGSLDNEIKTAMGFQEYTSPRMRHRIDAVSFLPFPKVGASEEEQFKPEFMVSLEVDAALGKDDNYFAAVAKYGGKTIKQMVNGGYPKFVEVFADPKTRTCFSASMLVNLDATELASTPDNAGELEIYLYRITKGYDFSKLALRSERDLGDVADLLGSTRSASFSFGGMKGLSALPTLPRRPILPPTEAPREVGDVKLEEGTRGEKVAYNTLTGYGADTDFGVQPIRIRFLGVREGSHAATLDALKDMSQRY